MSDKAQILSMNRFKLSNGEYKNVVDMSKTEHLEFVVAKLMKDIIEKLEVSIQNDRIFSRTKYDVMTLFHSAVDNIKLAADKE